MQRAAGVGEAQPRVGGDGQAHGLGRMQADRLHRPVDGDQRPRAALGRLAGRQQDAALGQRGDGRHRHARRAAGEPRGFMRLEPVARGRLLRRDPRAQPQPAERHGGQQRTAQERERADVLQRVQHAQALEHHAGEHGEQDRRGAQPGALAQRPRHRPARRGDGLPREGLVGPRPGHRRRRERERRAVGHLRRLVHLAMLRALARACRRVVQEAAEHLGAEGLVVGGARQVQVPGLVDIGRRAHRPARDLRQHEEAPVLLGHGQRVAQRPAVVVGQARLEGQRLVGGVEAEGFDALEQAGSALGQGFVGRGGVHARILRWSALL